MSNNADAYRAAQRPPSKLVIDTGRCTTSGVVIGPTYDNELAYTVGGLSRPIVVVLAGWDRLLTSAFVSHHITINLHPAKPGAFPGLGAIEKAYRRLAATARVDHGGVMVHYVPDEGRRQWPRHRLGTGSVRARRHT